MHIHLRAIVEAETALRKMGVLRTRNLVGDLAEWVACEELGLTRVPPSPQGYDAMDAGLLRVQIKGVRLPNRRAGALRGLDQDRFDRLVIVVFAEDLQTHTIVEMTRVEALDRASYQKLTNSWQLTLPAGLVWLKVGRPVCKK